VARGLEIVDRERDVKRTQCGHKPC
jgi:hypothetical protein